MLTDREDYLHSCLRLHGQVTEIRYGKKQDLGSLENRVAHMWAAGDAMWDVIKAIHDDDAFDAGMFGSFDRDSLKSKIDQTPWRDLENHEWVRRLFDAYRQIEPASVVLRFIDPKRFGIMSSPVQTVLGIRPRRKPHATYDAYLKSLQSIREDRHFDRIADVEMALWTLQVGVLDGMLPPECREELAKAHKEDADLRRIQARNLTVQLLNEMPKLHVADALLDTDVALAGQIAGIEFELLVVAASPRSREKPPPELRQHIDSLGTPYRLLHSKLHRAREIRNTAIHAPSSISRENVEFLIEVAKEMQPAPRKKG